MVTAEKKKKVASNQPSSIVDHLKAKGQTTPTQDTGQAMSTLGSLEGGGTPSNTPQPIAKNAPQPKADVVKKQIKDSDGSRYGDKIHDAETSLEGSLESYKEFLKSQSDSFFDNQESMLDSAKEKQLNDLKKAFDRAIKDGKMSEEEAIEQFEDNIEAINEEGYSASQATALSGEARGIGNSQQLLAMQQGDQRHTSSMRDDNRRDRDKRINEIIDRIDTISNEFDLDNIEAENIYQNDLRGARAQADQMIAEGMGEMSKAEYMQSLQDKSNLTMQEQAQLDRLESQQKDFDQQDKIQDKGFEHDENMQESQFAHDFEKMAKQHGYDIKKMDRQQKHDLTKMAKQYGYDIKKMNKQQVHDLVKMNRQNTHTLNQMSKQFGFDLSKMKTGHGYDMKKIDKTFGQDLKKMAKANGYDLGKMSVQQKYDLAKIKK